MHRTWWMFVIGVLACGTGDDAPPAPALDQTVASRTDGHPEAAGSSLQVAGTRTIGRQAGAPDGGRRLALVVGNAEYAEEAAKLTNPVRDARAMAAMLADLGFAVTRRENANIEEMDEAVDAFIRRVRSGDTAVFYYAGHGIELDGENYLLPVNFSSSYTPARAKRRSTSATEVQALMEEAGAEVRIVILDACRDNPFEGTRTFGRGGLAAMAPRGGLVAFAAESGARASDNRGQANGLYTQHLLEALERPGVPANVLFSQVQGAVRAASGGRQIPAYYDAGAGNFVFRRGVDPPPPPPPDPDPVPTYVAGEVFRDCAVCPEMVVIPAGTFRMGSPAREEGRYDDEGPQHLVTLRSFAMGVKEVTFDEWDACVRGGGCDGYLPDDEGWGRGSRPVINVSWEDAQAYVGWLSESTGAAYRLPSESEWEYAARGGTTTPFHTGATISTDQANYNGNYVRGRYRGRTTPVGTFAPNMFGLYDVHGNVWEWVEDCWHDNYRGAPSDGKAWERRGYCGRGVLRGGSWIISPRNLRSANRQRNSTERRGAYAGFRVSRTLD